jgi:hypothetical protein
MAQPDVTEFAGPQAGAAERRDDRATAVIVARAIDPRRLMCQPTVDLASPSSFAMSDVLVPSASSAATLSAEVSHWWDAMRLPAPPLGLNPTGPKAEALLDIDRICSTRAGDGRPPRADGQMQ